MNQEREYGKKIRRELNVTVVCWCWIVQDEKENAQTAVVFESVAVFIESVL